MGKLLAEKSEQIEAKRVLNRRHAVIALLLGAVILSPFFAFHFLHFFAPGFGCHVEPHLSDECILGGKEYSEFMNTLFAGVKVSILVFQNWVYFALLWVAISLFEARRVNKIFAIIIGGAYGWFGPLYNSLWDFGAQILYPSNGVRYEFAEVVFSLFQLFLSLMIPVATVTALIVFAIKNGFEVPPQETREATK